MSEIQIALEHRVSQLEAVLRQAREALVYHSVYDKRMEALAAIDAVLDGVPANELSDERIDELYRLTPDRFAFARAVLKEAGE